uniref:Zf-RVT domain-containing protein n=1 Tax=Heterorhabditis bacteriophora TaxID=37862 RepID=A0A1I7WA85_HETBA
MIELRKLLVRSIRIPHYSVYFYPNTTPIYLQQWSTVIQVLQKWRIPTIKESFDIEMRINWILWICDGIDVRNINSSAGTTTVGHDCLGCIDDTEYTQKYLDLSVEMARKT